MGFNGGYCKESVNGKKIPEAQLKGLQGLAKVTYYNLFHHFTINFWPPATYTPLGRPMVLLPSSTKLATIIGATLLFYPL